MHHLRVKEPRAAEYKGSREFITSLVDNISYGASFVAEIFLQQVLQHELVFFLGNYAQAAAVLLIMSLSVRKMFVF